MEDISFSQEVEIDDPTASAESMATSCLRKHSKLSEDEFVKEPVPWKVSAQSTCSLQGHQMSSLGLDSVAIEVLVAQQVLL